MNAVQRITSQGLNLVGDNDLNLAFLSLRIALKSYFSTYHSIRHRFNHSDNVGVEDSLVKEINYCESYAETIVHFQHFFELIIKDILRKDHLLLATRVYSHPIILHKILHNQTITVEEEQKVHSVEFSDALQTLCKLIKEEQILGFQDVKFVYDHKDTLVELNTLRNRVWHRGSFFLPYSDLDELVGKYIFPIVISMVNLTQYLDGKLIWRYNSTECGIDPINSIIIEYQNNPSPSAGKIALLKEIGRASYNNPLHDKQVLVKKRDERVSAIENKIKELKQQGKEIPHRLLISKKMADVSLRIITQYDAPHIKKAIKISKQEAEDELYSVIKCPVCGVDSFVLYDENDSCEDDDTGETVSYNFVHSAKCGCCAFEIDSKLKIESYNLPMTNYWIVREL